MKSKAHLITCFMLDYHEKFTALGLIGALTKQSFSES